MRGAMEVQKESCELWWWWNLNHKFSCCELVEDSSTTLYSLISHRMRALMMPPQAWTQWPKINTYVTLLFFSEIHQSRGGKLAIMLLNWVGVSLIAQQPVQLGSISSQRDSSRLMIICVRYTCDYMAAANRTRPITVGQRTTKKISDDLIDRLSDCAAFTHFIAHKWEAMIRNKCTCWHTRHMPSEVNNSIILISTQSVIFQRRITLSLAPPVRPDPTLQPFHPLWACSFTVSLCHGAKLTRLTGFSYFVRKQLNQWQSAQVNATPSSSLHMAVDGLTISYYGREISRARTLKMDSSG